MVELTAGVSLTVSHDGGRPPESIPHVDFNQPLERVGSPLVAEDQPVVKCGRIDSVVMDTMEGSEAMEMEADGLLSTKEREALAGDASTGLQPRVSYAHVVRDSLRGKDPTHVFEELSPDKIIVRDEDCVVDNLGRFPRISFAESVHAQINLISIPTATGPALEACSIKSSKELFGPWMIVDNRCRRIPPNKPSGGRQDLVMKDPLGSCFAVLNSSDTVEDTITGEVEVSPQASDELAPIGTDVQVASGPGVVRTVTVGIELPKRKPRSSPASSSQIETIPMLPGNEITVVEHRPHGASKDHQAVSLLERGNGSSGLDTGKSQAGRGLKLKQAKENARQGLMICKPPPAKTISRPVLSDWVDNVNQQLNSIAHRKELDPGGTPKIILTNEGVLDVISTTQTIPGRSSQYHKVGSDAGDRDGSLGQ
ncbi:hypothetical protein V6N11_024699 [Hibiscus sabdariffa]|uniref:Uncharacterized protein n=1 Tax=Hibiscus sabdariffa TaxID=183260 RepID=A0ABR2QMW8_9ROSI